MLWILYCVCVCFVLYYVMFRTLYFSSVMLCPCDIIHFDTAIFSSQHMSVYCPVFHSCPLSWSLSPLFSLFNLFICSQYCSHSSLCPILLYFLFSSVLFLMNFPVCVFVIFFASALVYLSSQPLSLPSLFVSLLCLSSLSLLSISYAFLICLSPLPHILSYLRWLMRHQAGRAICS